MWFWAPIFTGLILSGCAGLYTDWYIFMGYKTPPVAKKPLDKLPDSSELEL
jgi:hypothetical protein